MNIHIEATGGLVSNSRERETRGTREHNATALLLEVGTFSLDDRHIDKRDKGQLSNRNLRDPSYLGNSSFIEPISWAKILDLTKKVSYRKRKIYKTYL